MGTVRTMHDATTDRDDRVRQRLLDWYTEHRRDLPWRDVDDPWAVWVSEIMLQQTRVATVRGYYERWMERFPTVRALAEADIDDVLAAWQGLGYYSRARNLHRAARAVVESHDGEIPDDVDGLRALPGVGPYTAGAIASIAFGRRAALVDGNVIRVVARLLGIDDDMRRSAGQRAVWAWCESAVPAETPGDFNQALMELGATVCTPRAVRCERCPVASDCVALADDRVDALPVKGPRTPPRVEKRVALVARDDAGRVLVAQRPSTGLLAGLWEFPLLTPEDLDPQIRSIVGEVASSTTLADVVHVFSHIHLTATPVAVTVSTPPDAPELEAYARTRWVDPTELDALARSRLMQKLQAAVRDGQQGLIFG